MKYVVLHEYNPRRHLLLWSAEFRIRGGLSPRVHVEHLIRLALDESCLQILSTGTRLYGIEISIIHVKFLQKSKYERCEFSQQTPATSARTLVEFDCCSKADSPAKRVSAE